MEPNTEKDSLVTPAECDIVAFTAHPDDVELNCAGTLALAALQGWRAGAVEMTRGELSTRGTVEIRARETEAAARALGLSCRYSLGLPDGHLRDDDESRKAVVRAIRRLRPRVVIAPPLEDHHADHVATATIVSRALYLCGVAKYVPEVPIWRPHGLLHYVGSRAAVPQIVVDVTDVFDRRRDATLCFRSQFFQDVSTEGETRISHPDFLAAIEGTARRYGALIGVKYGEAYTSPEPLPVRNLVSIFDRAPWGV